MRTWEMVFQVSLFLYHIVLLFPRNRKKLVFHFSILFVALLAIIFLWQEGLRWQNLPAFVLLLIDLIVLIFTFKNLKKVTGQVGFFSSIKRFIRLVGATASFLLAGASLGLLALFPLPNVPLGGYPVAVRTLIVPKAQTFSKPLSLVVWYPTLGSEPVPRWLQTPEAWNFWERSGGPPGFFSSYLEYLPFGLSQGRQLPQNTRTFPIIIFLCPDNRRPQEWGFLMEYLASQGIVVAALSSFLPSEIPSEPLYRSLFRGLTKIQLQNLHESASMPDKKEVGPLLTLYVLQQLSQDASDLFYHRLDFDRQALVSLTAFSQELDRGFKTSIWLGQSAPQALKNNLIRRLFIPYQRTANESGEAFLPQGSLFWEVCVEGLSAADLSDSAFLRPYLFYLGDKNRLDSKLHVLTRGYLGAWLQFALMDGDPSLFEKYSHFEGVFLEKSL